MTLTICTVYHEIVTARVQAGPASAGAAAQTGGPPRGGEDQFADAMGLIQLSRLVQAVFARVADRHELTPMQARLLCVLAESPRGMAGLAREFGVEKAALTGLVDRAERRGLVERRAVPGDRRAVSVTLTPAGLRTAGGFHAEVTAELGQLMGSLTAGERASFRTALATITLAAEAVAGCA
jgi:DNA-binding MarR family transcriptional regulator